MTNKKRIALVTGASSGIGRAIAEKLASMDIAVVVSWAESADRSSEMIDATVNAIETANGTALAVEADLSSIDSVRQLYKQAIAWQGKLDIVVNCAGAVMSEPVATVTEDQFEKIFSINARGVFFSLQEAARCVSDGGRIINITSGSTNAAIPGNAVYGGSKCAVQYFTRALATELAVRAITVNSVSPGITETPMINEELKKKAVLFSPFKRLGQPDDVSDVVSLLVRDEAHWLTGQNIMATGGASVR